MDNTNISNGMHDELIGAGLSQTYINLMKLRGWIPIKEYFKMKRSGINLDWVLVLTIEDNGFQGIPMVAEYCVPSEKSNMLPGWYKDDVNSGNVRIDNWTNVIMFKLIDNDDLKVKDDLLDEFEKKENINDRKSYYNGFNENLIKTCINNENNRYINYVRSKVKNS